MDYKDCPLCHHYPDLDRCEEADMSPCVYETGDGPCLIFLDFIEEMETLK